MFCYLIDADDSFFRGWIRLQRSPRRGRRHASVQGDFLCGMNGWMSESVTGLDHSIGHQDG